MVDLLAGKLVHADHTRVALKLREYAQDAGGFALKERPDATIGQEAGCGSSLVLTNESNMPAMQMYRALGGRRINPDDVMFKWQMDHEKQVHDCGTTALGT